MIIINHIFPTFIMKFIVLFHHSFCLFKNPVTNKSTMLCCYVEFISSLETEIRLFDFVITAL